MKIVTAFLASMAICSSLSAQISLSGLNAPSSDYSNLNFSTPIVGNANWTPASDLEGTIFLKEGMSYDIIFLGEDAGFNQTDLYFIAGDSQAPYSTKLVFENIDSEEMAYGSYRTVSFLDVDGNGTIGDDFLFDFLLDSDEDQNIVVGGTTQGEFHLFDAASDSPFADEQGNAYANLIEEEPYLMFSFEDLDDSDYDFNDLFFAIKLRGTPYNGVPEPSTYGIIGALLLLGAIARRRLKL